MLPSLRARLAHASLSLLLGACTGNISDAASDGARGNTPGGAIGGGSNAGGTAPFVAFESLARRHTRAELDNTLRDLLGDDSGSAKRFLAEEEFAPYDNGYVSQQASQALIDSLEALAQDVGARLVADTKLRAALVPCTPTGPTDEACFQKTVEQLGRRAFRRPLATEEVAGYLPLLGFAKTDVAGAQADFFSAVELVVRAVLQDPEFLYRIEVGAAAADSGARALDDYEIATRLSYLLWGSTPDDALLSHAAAGGLSEADQRRTEAERMLRDPRAKAQLQRFHAMWLGYRAIPHTPELTAAFASETAALIDRVVFDERRDYFDLFRMNETYVDATLADHYGLAAPKQAHAWVAYGNSGRAGILSHGSVLSAFSKFSDTSPTQRGIFIRTRLLCQSVGSPPPEVMVDQAPVSEESPCKAQRYAAHAHGSCAGCHNQIDPIGFGLERFDIAGRYREHDDGLPQCSIEGKGALPGFGEFSGPAELGQKLIASGQLEACVVRQYLSFALGRSPLDAELSELTELSATFRARDRGFVELLLELIGSDAFALRKEPS